MHRRIARASVLAAVTVLSSAAVADWKQILQQSLGGADSGSVAAAALGNDEVVAGLKEALAKGAENAVSSLGRPGGFLSNPAVRIPLPERLQGVESVLRTLGQGQVADRFVETLNRAAESAVPESGAILGDAIRQMSVDDAKQILSGPDDAATRYFRKVGEERLTGRLLPIVRDATSKAGVTSAYKQVIDSAGPAAALVDSDAKDLDGYVTREALDGLFALIAAEEKQIRENPAARTTELLQKVFGAGR